MLSYPLEFTNLFIYIDNSCNIYCAGAGRCDGAGGAAPQGLPGAAAVPAGPGLLSQYQEDVDPVAPYRLHCYSIEQCKRSRVEECVLVTVWTEQGIDLPELQCTFSFAL